MHWKLLVPLGLTGIAPPLATYALGGNPAIAAVLWTLLAAIVWVPLVLRAKEPSPFVAVLVVGVIAGVAAGVVDLAMSGDPMLLAMAIVIGAVWGALFGAIALGVRRWQRGRSGATA